MHYCIDRDPVIIRFVTIVDRIRKSSQQVATNLRLFDDWPARGTCAQRLNCGFDCNEGGRDQFSSLFEIIPSGGEILFSGFGMKTVTSHQLAGVLSAKRRRARASASSPGIRSTSPDSTSAILRRTSASCALVISGETSSARLPINRSANSARTSGESVIASRKISSDVAMRKRVLADDVS